MKALARFVGALRCRGKTLLNLPQFVIGELQMSEGSHCSSARTGKRRAEAHTTIASERTVLPCRGTLPSRTNFAPSIKLASR
jgi:hypothetical protein